MAHNRYEGSGVGFGSDLSNNLKTPSSGTKSFNFKVSSKALISLVLTLIFLFVLGRSNTFFSSPDYVAPALSRLEYFEDTTTPSGVVKGWNSYEPKVKISDYSGDISNFANEVANAGTYIVPRAQMINGDWGWFNFFKEFLNALLGYWNTFLNIIDGFIKFATYIGELFYL